MTPRNVEVNKCGHSDKVCKVRQSENDAVMKCVMTRFSNDTEKHRNTEMQMQRCRGKTHNAEMQAAMQDAVHSEHKQLEMPAPPKVLHHKHNCQSVQRADEDKDEK